MAWSEISTILLILLLVWWAFSLERENSRLKKENSRLLKATGQYDDMKNEAKEILKDNTEIKTIKSMREKYGLSLLDAKELVDAAKNN